LPAFNADSISHDNNAASVAEYEGKHKPTYWLGYLLLAAANRCGNSPQRLDFGILKNRELFLTPNVKIVDR